MTVHYPVYVEVGEDGHCMIHVLALPGCFARAYNRQEAFLRLPGAIHNYLKWLRDHGQPAAPAGVRITTAVAEETAGTGGFNPGDKVALFTPERAPLSPEEMAPFFDLMGLARADLLRAAASLPEPMLDWKPDPRSFNVQEVLRHVAQAEKWYVSRLIPPERLPTGWMDDESGPALDALERVRSHVLELLAGLDDETRAGVHYPAAWTIHPDEAWTARKALRRFIEHEREHTGQIHQNLSFWNLRHHPHRLTQPIWQ